MDVPAELRALFAGWEKPMVLACLQGRMGSVHTGGGTPPQGHTRGLFYRGVD